MKPVGEGIDNCKFIGRRGILLAESEGESMEQEAHPLNFWMP